MPEKIIKRRLQECDAAFASDDGPVFSTVAKLVEALKRSLPEGTQNAKLKNGALRLGRLVWKRATDAGEALAFVATTGFSLHQGDLTLTGRARDEP
jgi:hypothetical protein